MMMEFTYELHLHSCLSPCGDDLMTPNNIAGMAMLNGVKIAALTDHNTSRNCPAFFEACAKVGVIPVAGMELTTAEDIHVICLFPTLESAMEFDFIVSEKLIKVENKPKIFGNQLLLDENDEVVGEEKYLLINATSLDLESAYKLCDSFGGVCYPAHIDRESGGLIAVLGDFPSEPHYPAFELNFKDSFEEYTARYPAIVNKQFVVSSDAHNLWSISEAENFLELDDEPYSSAKVREALIGYLKGK